VYLSNADKAKYGSILKGLSTQQSLSNDQYPRTITDANNVLSNHPFDNFKSSSKKENKDNNKNNQIRMTSPMRRRMNKNLLCHLLSSKESATAVESQGTGCQSAMKRTILEKNGPFIRLSRVTSKHRRVPTLPQEAATIQAMMG
jgi:hypothetical protein